MLDHALGRRVERAEKVGGVVFGETLCETAGRAGDGNIEAEAEADIESMDRGSNEKHITGKGGLGGKQEGTATHSDEKYRTEIDR